MTKKNLKRAIIISLIVGSILNLINSYDVLWQRNFTLRNTLRIILTFIPPFCVSLYSSTQASKKHKVE